jgi:hypothetical protein
MDRKPHQRRFQFALLAACAVAMLGTSGCASVLSTAMWVIKGHNVPPEWDGLEGRRVAVVCRPPQSLQPSVAFAATEIATELGKKLAIKGAQIEVVDQREVAEWTDENIWEEYTEVGEALDVDMVVAVELDHFALFGSQTIYQGTADLSIQVYDMRDGGHVVWSKTLPESKWPPVAGGVPVSDKREADFRREFVDKLTDQIGRHFYTHDKYESFADDTSSLR